MKKVIDAMVDKTQVLAPTEKAMKISIFGLGYVGAVSYACFSKVGHEVIGVDISEHKVNLINDGKSPIMEAQLEDYMGEAKEGKVSYATSDMIEAIKNTELSVICVGTPSAFNGNIDLSYVYNVCNQIGEALKEKDEYHSVVIRSTVVPGTIKDCIGIIEDISGKKHLEGFGMGFNPEFLREGTAIYDFWNPPYTIIGTKCAKTEARLLDIYAQVDAPVYNLKPEEAEMIKYANNNFHALKVTFANEIGNICKELGVDGHAVMDIVAKDKKLNLSPYYLKPGFAFGGSCLPKDVRGLNYQAKKMDLRTPLLNSLMESNDYQLQRGLQLIYKTKKKKIGILGFAFKAGTDDMRESPMVTLIETLLGKGFEVSIYDSNVLLSKLMGKNKDFLTNHIPHISRILKDSMTEVVEESDVIVLGNKSDEFKKLFEIVDKDQIIIDLVRIDKGKVSGDNYEGICW